MRVHRETISWVKMCQRQETCSARLPHQWIQRLSRVIWNRVVPTWNKQGFWHQMKVPIHSTWCTTTKSKTKTIASNRLSIQIMLDQMLSKRSSIVRNLPLNDSWLWKTRIIPTNTILEVNKMLTKRKTTQLMFRILTGWAISMPSKESWHRKGTVVRVKVASNQRAQMLE